jgi:hypothetical protein
MKSFSLPNVSVASSGDEYFEVSFDAGDDDDSPYFLMQRQLESPDGGVVYIESHEEALCGHFRVRKAPKLQPFGIVGVTVTETT